LEGASQPTGLDASIVACKRAGKVLRLLKTGISHITFRVGDTLMDEDFSLLGPNSKK
jgi:hypothetical protein